MSGGGISRKISDRFPTDLPRVDIENNLLDWGLCIVQRTHPRSRGENETCAPERCPPYSSSPITRKMPAVRLISDHAGKTHNATRVAHLPGDHSQVGWLPPSCVPCHYSEKDSSPLTQGTHVERDWDRQVGRITPAHAGNTPSDLCKHHTAQADYGSTVERLSLSYSSYHTPTTKEAQLESLVRHRYERPQARQTSNQ